MKRNSTSTSKDCFVVLLFQLVFALMLNNGMVLGQECMLTGFPENIPPPAEGRRSRMDHLPSGTQAVITGSELQCCGNITAWKAFILPGNTDSDETPRGDQQRTRFTIYFQVWRSFRDSLCFTLVGQNIFRSIQLGGCTTDEVQLANNVCARETNGGFLVDVTPEASDIITVQRGDIIGYYGYSVNEMGDPLPDRDEGIQVINLRESSPRVHYYDRTFFFMASFLNQVQCFHLAESLPRSQTLALSLQLNNYTCLDTVSPSPSINPTHTLIPSLTDHISLTNHVTPTDHAMPTNRAMPFVTIPELNSPVQHDEAALVIGIVITVVLVLLICIILVVILIIFLLRKKMAMKKMMMGDDDSLTTSAAYMSSSTLSGNSSFKAPPTLPVPLGSDGCSDTVYHRIEDYRIGGSPFYAAHSEDVSFVTFSGDQDTSSAIYAEIGGGGSDERPYCRTGPDVGGSNEVSSSRIYESVYNYIGTCVPTEAQRHPTAHYEQQEQDNTTTLGTYSRLQFFVEDHAYWAPATTESGLYAQLASKRYREVHRDQIRLLEKIGSGLFGEVCKALWTVDGHTLELAVKTLQTKTTNNDKVRLLQEAAIMGQFKHHNVVKLYGVVTLGNPVMICLELLKMGDLRSYLLNMNSSGAVSRKSLNLFLKFAKEIAAGMDYLSQKSFVHRDLAARNVLLNENLTCKIGDFGMARDLINDTYYKSSIGGQIPIKWTAPEALFYKRYSPKSDVWSYGMVLFEIWSVGKKPFSAQSFEEVLKLLHQGFCQAPPPGCPRAIYKLMVDCWNPSYQKRPTFNEISVQYLQQPPSRLLYWSPENDSLSPSVGVLGAPLKEAYELHRDLQDKYKKSEISQ